MKGTLNNGENLQPASFPGRIQSGGSMGTTSQASYRDKLAGSIPGAFAEAFQIDRYMEEDSDDDTSPEACDDSPRILLIRAEKARIRAPWRDALIVKPYGKPLEYHYLLNRLQSLWSPMGKMECSDIGHGFLIVKFHEKEDRNRVLREGPWFVNQRFLTIRMWEPYFCPAKASFSSVAVWLRLPGLPKEFYDPLLIKRAINQIGPLLRVDGITALGVRSQFARFCVQIDLEVPIPSCLWIGKWKQVIQIEGIDKLCFHCGIIGHRRENCPSLQPVEEQPLQQSTGVQEEGFLSDGRNQGNPVAQQEDEGMDGHGPWTLVPPRRSNQYGKKGKATKAINANGNMRTERLKVRSDGKPELNKGNGTGDGACGSRPRSRLVYREKTQLKKGSVTELERGPQTMEWNDIGSEDDTYALKHGMDVEEVPTGMDHIAKPINKSDQGLLPLDQARRNCMDIELETTEMDHTTEPTNVGDRSPTPLGQGPELSGSTPIDRESSFPFTFHPFILKSIADQIVNPNPKGGQENPTEFRQQSPEEHSRQMPSDRDKHDSRNHQSSDEPQPDKLDNRARGGAKGSEGGSNGGSQLGVASTKCAEGHTCSSTNRGRCVQPSKFLASKEITGACSDANSEGTKDLACGSPGTQDKVSGNFGEADQELAKERRPESRRLRQVLADARSG